MIHACFPQGYSLISGLTPYLKGVYSRERALGLWEEVVPEMMLMPNSDCIVTTTGLAGESRRGLSSNWSREVWREGRLRTQLRFQLPQTSGIGLCLGMFLANES